MKHCLLDSSFVIDLLIIAAGKAGAALGWLGRNGSAQAMRIIGEIERRGSAHALLGHRSKMSSCVELSIDQLLKRLRKLCPRRGGALDGDTFA